VFQLRPPLLVVALLGVSATASAAPGTRDCIRANEAAQDLRRTGKLVAAHEDLLTCIAASCPGPIRADCLQRLHEVDAALPKLVFDVKDGTGSALAAVRVSDAHGKVLATHLDGTAIPVDPGPLHLVFEGADGLRTEVDLVAREGDGERHVPVILALPHVEAPVVVAAPPSSPPPLPPPPMSPPRDVTQAGRTQRSAGLALGGGGVVSLVVGTIFAVVAKATYDGAKGCPSACTGPGYQQGQTAYTDATVATAGFIAGAALLAGGATLYLTAPRGPRVDVSPTVGSGALGLGVRFPW
jgi:hypothetical protein